MTIHNEKKLNEHQTLLTSFQRSSFNLESLTVIFISRSVLKELTQLILFSVLIHFLVYIKKSFQITPTNFFVLKYSLQKDFSLVK